MFNAQQLTCRSNLAYKGRADDSPSPRLSAMKSCKVFWHDRSSARSICLFLSRPRKAEFTDVGAFLPRRTVFHFFPFLYFFFFQAAAAHEAESSCALLPRALLPPRSIHARSLQSVRTERHESVPHTATRIIQRTHTHTY